MKTFTSIIDTDAYIESLDHDQLNSKKDFFGDSPAFVCCEITQNILLYGPEPPNVDKEMREKMWESYKDGLHGNVIIKIEAEKKEFNVSLTLEEFI